MKPWRGVETTTLWLLSVLTFLPAYLLFRHSSLPALRTKYDLVAFVVDVLLYSSLLLLVAALIVRKYHEFPPNDWPFRWLRESHDGSNCRSPTTASSGTT